MILFLRLLLNFFLIEKIYQTLETVFHSIWLSKHLEFRQKYSIARRIFNSLIMFACPNEAVSLVFDILLELLVPGGAFQFLGVGLGREGVIDIAITCTFIILTRN